MRTIKLLLGAALAAPLLLAPLALAPAAQAQSKDYFVPGQTRPAPARPAPARPAPPPAQIQAAQPAPDEAPVQIPMPPVPDLPALPKGASPPAAVIGVIGVPEVMRASLAAQAVDKVMSSRREKLNADAQKEQEVWRSMQQALAAERNKLSPEQLRTKERELQDRITTAQKGFRERNRVIQEQLQYALNQIQASLIAVIRQVADSRGMNLVLHRAQVALNVNEFDITEQVAEQLNKIQPAVQIPPEGVPPPLAETKPAPAAPAAPAAAKPTAKP